MRKDNNLIINLVRMFISNNSIYFCNLVHMELIEFNNFWNGKISPSESNHRSYYYTSDVHVHEYILRVFLYKKKSRRIFTKHIYERNYAI